MEKRPTTVGQDGFQIICSETGPRPTGIEASKRASYIWHSKLIRGIEAAGESEVFADSNPAVDHSRDRISQERRASPSEEFLVDHPFFSLPQLSSQMATIFQKRVNQILPCVQSYIRSEGSYEHFGVERELFSNQEPRIHEKVAQRI